MSTANSPAIAALKARLEEQSTVQKGTYKLNASPRSEKFSADACSKWSPPSPLKHKVSRTGNGSSHMKRLSKQLDDALSHGQKGGSPSPANVLQLAHPPPLKLKNGSPGVESRAVRDGWQHQVYGDSVPQHQEKTASSSLSSILQGHPLSSQTGEGGEKGRETGFSQVVVKSLPPHVKGRIKGTEISSTGVGSRRTSRNRLSSRNSLPSDEEEACSLRKGPGVKGGQKANVIKYLESSISSNEGDLCDINCKISPDISSSAISSVYRKLSTSSSEENLPSLVSVCDRKSKTLSLICDNLSSPSCRNKPLPTPPVKSPPLYAGDNFSKIRSVSDLTSSGSEIKMPAVPLKPKPQVAGTKPSTGRTKPVGGTAKPPVQRLKPSGSTKKVLDFPGDNIASASVPKIAQNKSNLCREMSDRQRPPPPPPPRIADKRGTNEGLLSDSTKPPLGKKIPPAPCIRPTPPPTPYIGELQESHFSKCIRDHCSSPEVISFDSQELKDAMASRNSNLASKSEALGSPAAGTTMEELEDTLTAAQSCDLETTLVGTSGELSEDWIMVLDKKKKTELQADTSSSANGAESSTKKHVRKPPTVLSKPATNSHHQTSSSAETERNPPLLPSTFSIGRLSTNRSKPLPLPPSRVSLTLVDMLSPPGDALKSPQVSKVSTLKATFSNTHSAPPPLPSTAFCFPIKSSSVEAEVEPKCPVANKHQAGNASARELTRSVTSPSTRITPGSIGNGHTGDTNSSTHNVAHECGGTICRVNTDSGFISEAPDDDLGLHRDMAMESFPGVSRMVDLGGAVGIPAMNSPGSVSVDEREGVEEEEDVWDDVRLEKARKKRLNIAMELLETEKTYSGHIKVVAVDFCKMVEEFNKKSRQVIPDSSIYQIFLNIEQIYTLSVNILQELQDRMDAWSTNEALGDVICRLAPFLKLYSTYTSGFEDAITTLTECTKKDRKFDAMVREFERTSISTGLGLASFMLEPVQRIPRYRLLLRDYLKYLPPNSPDKVHTERALRIISEAADLSNGRIKELENSNELLAIQRSVVDYEGTLLVPSRSFIMKGSLLKYSRKSLSPRFFFLFSDVLLHLYPPENNVYKFRNELPLCGMQVEDPKVSLTSFSFNIYCTTRSLILVASSEEEKQIWISALMRAIQNEIKKTSSLKRDSRYAVNKVNTLFGTNAPLMVPDKSVTMCQTCGTVFTMMFRRHHCRACGKVVCSDCSKHKAYLPYLLKMDRVCDICYSESKNPDRPAGCYGEDGENLVQSPLARKQESVVSVSSVLNLRGYDDDAVIAGYVLCQEGKKWNKMWYQVKTDCVLYKFKAHEDIKAITSMPLPGYSLVSDTSQGTFTLNHHSGMKNYCETFRLEDSAAFDSWLNCLGKVINMELDTLLDCPPSPPLGSLDDITGYTSLSRPHSQLSNHSRSDSFSTVSSDSEPTSSREVSPS